ncbi:MAG TPA: Crp/Fnr family transcriptional regulator [Anaerolineales bacterium]|nr:Crp/Fnr family transcriptional regulator [Anaerolineales bacterium]
MPVNPIDLRRVHVFEKATDDDLKLLVQRAIERSIEEGEFFFFQGDPATYLYILISGRAKLMQTSKAGQQVNLRTINEWQLFGALGAVREQATYPATAQALESSTALAIESSFLHEMMQTRPQLSFGLMQLMTGYIQEMQARYRELATEKVEQRIARALLRLVATMGVRVEGNAVELTFTRQQLAEISGTTLFTVSRVLSDWEKQAIVETGREKVRILKPHDLVQIAEGLNKKDG